MAAVINLIIQKKSTYTNLHFPKLGSNGTYTIGLIFTGKLGIALLYRQKRKSALIDEYWYCLFVEKTHSKTTANPISK